MSAKQNAKTREGEKQENVTQENATWGLDRIDQRQLPLDNRYTYNTTGRGVNVYVISAVTNSIAAGVTYVVAAGNSSEDACNFSLAHLFLQWEWLLQLLAAVVTYKYQIRNNPHAQVLYVLGWWVWCYRLPALITYAAVALILVLVYGTVQELVLRPSIGNLVLTAFGLGLSFLFAWITWRGGQSRATRIVFLPDRGLLIVRTLNFTSRRIHVAVLGDIEYEESQPYSDVGAYDPALRVQVRGGLPIEIDLQGRILDEQAFKALFHLSTAYKAARNHSKKNG
jgi:hypothetical protein